MQSNIYSKSKIQRRKPKALEEKEQIALFKRASYYPEINNYLFAIPNGGKRDAVTAYKLKLQGVKAGVSDIFFAYPSQGYHGLWIEMKKPKATNSSVSESQKDWLSKMESVGYMAKVAKGADEAWAFLQDYLHKT